MMPLIFGEPGKTYFIKKFREMTVYAVVLRTWVFLRKTGNGCFNNCAGMIVRIKDTRVAVSRELAGRIMI